MFHLWRNTVVIIIFAFFVVSIQSQQTQPTLDRIQPDYATLQFEVVETIGYVCDGGITVDQFGFVQMTCQTGVVRFDGIESHVQRIFDDEIDFFTASAIMQDPSGVYWITSQTNGVLRIDYENGLLKHYLHVDDDPNSLSSSEIPHSSNQALLQDSRGRVWIGTRHGLNLYRPDTDDFIAYFHDEDDSTSLSHNHITAIFEDFDGQIWVGTRMGLNRLDEPSMTFERFMHDTDDPDSLSSDEISAIEQTEDKILWIGTANGLNKFDYVTNTNSRYYRNEDGTGLGENIIYALEADEFGTLWMGHNLSEHEILTIFEPDTETFHTYAGDPQAGFGLPDTTSITGLYYDVPTGIMWVVDQLGTLIKYDPQAFLFELYQHQPDNENSLSNSAVLPMEEDENGNIWLGSAAGLNRYDPETDTFTAFFHDTDDPTTIRTQFISAIRLDPDGTLWLGNSEPSISQFDAVTGEVIETFYLDNGQVPRGAIVSTLLQDQENPDYLWMTGWNESYVARFDKSAETFTYYDGAGSMYMMYDDGDGSIWGATNPTGLYHLDKATGDVTFYLNGSDRPDMSGFGDLWDDGQGHIWVLHSHMILRFDKEQHTYETMLELPKEATSLATMLPDDNGNLWISDSLNGICRLTIDTLDFLCFNRSSGITDSTFFREARLKTSQGQLWFGSLDGVNAFYPDDIHTNLLIPDVYITSLTHNGVPLFGDLPAYYVDEVTLDYSNNSLEFEYVALNYTHSEQNRYQYFLEGFDRDWYDAGTTRFGRYASLPSGDYTLYVRGSNDDGVWNEAGTSIRIRVEPPWWEEWWFRILMLSLLGGAIGGVFWLRLRIIERRNQQLENLVEERTKELEIARDKAEAANVAKSQFLSVMSHELRTPLNAILGYAQIFRRYQDVPQAMREGIDVIEQSGEHLLLLINDILDLAKIEAGKLELFATTTNLSRFLESVGQIIRIRANEKDLIFTFESLSKLPDGIVVDEKRLRQILLNLLSNAVKFTDDGYVRLTVTEVNRERKDDINYTRLRFEVIDTGVGLSSDELERILQPFEQVGDIQSRAEGTGLGLPISQQLLQLMDSRLEIHSEQMKGSTFAFEISVPIAERIHVKSSALFASRVIGFEEGTKSIFLVDDNKYNLLVLASLLEPLGFEIFTSDNAKSAIERITQSQPDLILTDLIMPEMTGFQLAAHLRQDTQTSAIPIVAISASVFDINKQDDALSDFNAFLRKPINADEVLEVVQSLLDLTWIETVSQVNEIDSTELMRPSQDVLEQIKVQLERGNLRKIREIAMNLVNDDEGYQWFARLIKDYTHSYNEDAIRQMINRYLDA